jgi:predicted acetyltransferase
MQGYAYQRLTGAADARALGEVLALSFGLPAENVPAWFDNAGRENIRVLREARDTVGGLFLLPMGQYFGGRSVPMVGVAAVGVAPHRRGRGAAITLMQEAMRELRRDRVALSALYPAVQELYRRVGYQQAGARFELTVPVGQIGAHRDTGSAALGIQMIGPRDNAAIVELYRRVAADSPGWLDRSAYIWNRVRNPRGEKAIGYAAVSSSGSIEGYAYVVQRVEQGGRHSLALTDVVSSTPGAARRLLSFLDDQRSLATTVRFFGGAAPPLVTLIPEQPYTMRLHRYWMLRVVDLERALEARGYPSGLSTQFDLEITDDLLAENAGRWTVSIARGRARVRRAKRRGKSGAVHVGISALAALYSGHMSARALSSLGLVHGSGRDLARLDAAFGGYAPGCPTRWPPP